MLAAIKTHRVSMNAAKDHALIMNFAEKVGTSTKYHHFNIEEGKTGGYSLCGRWLLLQTSPDHLDDSKHHHPENCLPCQRKRLKLEVKHTE